MEVLNQVFSSGFFIQDFGALFLGFFVGFISSSVIRTPRWIIGLLTN